MRVLLLGDSFAFGIGSDYDHIWPVLVERELSARGRRFELVKAGVPGYDTRLEVLYLKNIFAQTAPDAVVLGFLTNDVFTNEPLESTGEELSAQPAVVRADEKDLTLHLVTLLQRLLMSNDRVYSTLYRLTPRRQYFETPPNAEVRSRLAVTSSLLSEAARFCRDHGVPLIVLSIPQLLQVSSRRVATDMKGWTSASLTTSLNGLPRRKDSNGSRSSTHWHERTGRKVRISTIDGTATSMSVATRWWPRISSTSSTRCCKQPAIDRRASP